MNLKIKIYKVLKFIGRKALFWMAIGVLSGICMSFLDLMLSLLFQELLNVLGISNTPVKAIFGFTLPSPTPIQFAFYLVTIGFFRSLMNFLITQSAAVSNETISSRLKLIAFYEALQLKSGYQSLSNIQTQLAEIYPKATLFSQYFALMIPNIVYATLLIVMMGLTAPEATSIGVMGLFTIAIIVHQINHKVRLAASQLPTQFRSLSDQINRVLKNFFLLKALRTTTYEHHRLIQSALNYSTLGIRTSYYANFASNIPNFLGLSLMALLLFRQIEFKLSDPSVFLSFLYLFIRFVQILGALASHYGVINMNYPHFRLAVKYFFSFGPDDISKAVAPSAKLSASGRAVQTEGKSHESNPNLNERGSNPAPSISIIDVSYAYPNSHSNAIKSISFQVEAGTQFALVGKSGSGKSTLLALILGLIDPNKGRVTIAGLTPSAFFSNKSLSIGYVGPEPYLIEGTVKQNLHYGNVRNYSDEDCISALKMAQLESWILSTPNPLDYFIRENGEGLSTGQKQRLSIARAIIGAPQLLILDEVSANIDTTTELELAEFLKKLKGKTTCIIASHRQGILKYADKIYDLENL
jgi:ABC-type multidrug transport system fused ATPase/permease subunit